MTSSLSINTGTAPRLADTAFDSYPVNSLSLCPPAKPKPEGRILS